MTTPMNTEQQAQSTEHTAAEPSWGAAPPKRKTSRRTVAAVGVAAAIALAGGVTVYATSGSDSSTTSGQGGPGGGAAPGGSGGTGGPAGGGASALHGSYTVANTSGSGYHTELMQTGKVTAITSTSITMVSTDNYTKTYTIDSGTVVQAMGPGGPGAANTTQSISTIAAGDTVTVTAGVSGSAATVDTITEQTT